MIVVNHGLSKGVILTSCTKMVDAVGIAKLFSTMSSNSSDCIRKLCQIMAPNSDLPLLES